MGKRPKRHYFIVEITDMSGTYTQRSMRRLIDGAITIGLEGEAEEIVNISVKAKMKVESGLRGQRSSRRT